MFLIINESGEVRKVEKLTDELKNECNDGYITIINIVTVTEYYNNEWHYINNYLGG